MGWALAIPDWVYYRYSPPVPTQYTHTPGTPMPPYPCCTPSLHEARAQRLALSVKTAVSGPPTYHGVSWTVLGPVLGPVLGNLIEY